MLIFDDFKSIYKINLLHSYFWLSMFKIRIEKNPVLLRGDILLYQQQQAKKIATIDIKLINYRNEMYIFIYLGTQRGFSWVPPRDSPKPTFFGPSWGIIEGSVEYHEKNLYISVFTALLWRSSWIFG